MREELYRPLSRKKLAEEKRKLLELLEDLQAIGTPPGGVQERDPFEFPERPDL